VSAERERATKGGERRSDGWKKDDGRQLQNLSCQERGSARLAMSQGEKALVFLGERDRVGPWSEEETRHLSSQAEEGRKKGRVHLRLRAKKLMSDCKQLRRKKRGKRKKEPL